MAGEWQRRRLASVFVRVVALLVPISAAALAGVVVARALPPGGLVRVGVALAVSTVVLLAVERAARRLLPLAALLRLTLVFPDRAPSRVAVALRSRNLRSMRGWAQEVTAGEDTDGGHGADVDQRATDVLALAAALNAHDRRTRGHSERVRLLSLLMAEELGLSEAEMQRLGWGALLHDIGKLTVPAKILNKAGAPDAREWQILRRHPADGARIAEPLQAWMGEWIDAIGAHHEQYDGTGYPRGISGDDITLSARIVSITDSFETMTAVRSYKKPLSAAVAREELARAAGTHFDPRLVRAFFNISLGRLGWTVGLASWLAQLPFLGLVPRAGAALGHAPALASGYGAPMAGAVGVALTLSGPPAVGPTPTAEPTGAGRTLAATETADATGTGRAAGDTQAPDAAVTAIQPEAPLAGAGLPAPPALPPPTPGPPAEIPAGPPADLPAAPPAHAPAGPPDGSPGNGGGNGNEGGGGAVAGGCPPGQTDMDWSEHPQGGPPGQAARC